MFLTGLGAKWTETSADVRAQCWNKTSPCALYSFSSLVCRFSSSHTFPSYKQGLHSWVSFTNSFSALPPLRSIKSDILELLNQFVKSIILPPLAVFRSHLLFVFSSLLLGLCLLLYWLSRVSFSSDLYHLSFSRLILSCCLPLQLSGEPGRLFQCMRADNHSAVIMSAFLSSLSARVVLMWRKALSL